MVAILYFDINAVQTMQTNIKSVVNDEINQNLRVKMVLCDREFLLNRFDFLALGNKFVNYWGWDKISAGQLI